MTSQETAAASFDPSASSGSDKLRMAAAGTLSHPELVEGWASRRAARAGPRTTVAMEVTA
jgi:hypothetical protein